MSKKLTDEELFAQFEGIGEEAEPAAAKKPTSKPSTAPQPDPDDLFQELGIPERPKAPISRPHTPKVSSTTTTPALRSSPKRNSTATPPSSEGAARSSEERAPIPRKSGESTRSFHNSFTPKTDYSAEAEQNEPSKEAAPTPAAPEAQSSGGGWWGSVFSTASAAVKQAEALAKEIRANEEAQRWASQVAGNVGALRGLGGELRSRALPTFTNILHSLAPPISAHERLQIHLTHDIVGYPALDPLIYSTFSRVMSQVEGGDLMVIQRGQESSRRRSSVDGYTGSSSSGWSDGPWWRQASGARNLGSVKGVTEGTKLSKASAESYANEYYSARGGLEEAAKQATEVLSESNPTRSSDIFLAFQAITHAAASELFGETRAADLDNTKGQAKDNEKQEAQDTAGNKEAEVEELLTFAIYLHDPVHGITYNTLTQSLPAQWTSWLDSTPPTTSTQHPEHNPESSLPADIAEIIQSGGVDPREWVAEWVEEVLALGVGVVAQRYVARRMGVGIAGQASARGKQRYEVEDSGAGEGARAV